MQLLLCVNDEAAVDYFRASLHDSGGTIYGMSQKTTVYLPEDLKEALSQEAKRRGCSEAEVIREAVAAVVSRPAPTPAILEVEPFAERTDELLEGFGER